MRTENLYQIFSKMPELETPRLFLRAMRVRDTEDMYAYAKDPEVTRYLLWSPHKSPDYTRSYLEYLAGRYRLGQHYEWAMVSKADGHMIGTCGFSRIECPHNAAGIGYVLNPAYWGQGLVAEAAERVLRFGFDVLGLHRVEARYMVGNDASRRVMEKLGMRFEGVRRGSMLVKGVYRDIGICSILVNEYRERRPRE